MDAERTNDEFYLKYPLEIHDDPARFEKIASLCSGKVLDIGCGTGTLSKYYKGDYTGVDVSSVAITKADTNRRTDAEFWRADATKTCHFAGRKFDTIVMAEFLEHLSQEDRLFANLKDWSHSKTKWIISVPNAGRIKDPDHHRIFTVAELRARFSQYGHVRFHNWPGFIGRIIMSVSLDEAPRYEIGLAMMLWNEGKGIERAILSCIEFADEIVVSIDDRTNDDTLEIAKLYADKVKFHKWRNDFSAARNWTHKGMRSDWIFALDGHEFVKQAPAIHERIKTNADGLLIKVEMESGASFYYPRLYRRGIEFKNPVHNLIQTKNPEPYRDFIIVHDRANGLAREQQEARNEQRSFMMPVFFRINLFWDKKDARSRYYLARYYQDRKNFKKALKHYLLYLRYSTSSVESWNALYQAHICALMLNKPRMALAYLDMADKLIPLRWELLKRRGIIYKVLGLYQQAIINLKASLEQSPHVIFDSPEAKDEGKTYLSIGECYFSLKKYRDALSNWENALKFKLDEKDKAKTDKRIAFVTDLINNPNKWLTTPQHSTAPATKKTPLA